MIGVKIKSEFEIFDYLVNKEGSGSESHIQTNTHVNYEDEALLTETINQDLMVLYLGEISTK